jgi:hypothetical protein
MWRRTVDPWLALAVVGGFLWACDAVPDPRVPVPQAVVEVAVEGARGGAHFEVGLDGAGSMCILAGDDALGYASCGGGSEFETVAVQTEAGIIVAGYVLPPATGVSLIFDGGPHRPVALAPVPDRDELAFGVIVAARPLLLEVEVVDDAGEVIRDHFPTIQPAP